MTSCEQGLITKKGITTHTNYFKFELALYSNAFFNSSRKLF